MTGEASQEWYYKDEADVVHGPHSNEQVSPFPCSNTES